jgi:putative salt-induced outer membrane protein YdiY
MSVRRLSWAVGWFVVGCLAAMIGLGPGVARCADDSLPERLVLATGEHLLGHSHGVEEGELLWESEPGEVLRIPFGLIDRVEAATLTLAVDTSTTEPLVVPPAELPPSPVGPDAGGAEPSWIESVPFITVVPRTYHVVAGTANTWTQRINFGGQFIQGNAQVDMLNLMVNFENNTPRRMRQIDVSGQWGRNRNRQTANKWMLNGNFDWPLDEDNKWISFFSSKNEYDAPANLDYRGTLSTGLGYRFYNDAKRRLITRFGPAYTIEVFREPREHRESPDLFAEMEIRWPLPLRASLEQRMRVQPSVLDFELVRVFSTSGLMFDLDTDNRWKLRLGLQYTYNSEPNPGRVPSDYTSTVSLMYTRK